MPRTHRPVALCLLLPLVLCLARETWAETFPYRLVVEASYGAPRGPQSLIDEVSLALVQHLESRRCFLSVERAGRSERDGADFRLSMTFNDFVEEVEYLATIAERARAVDPEIGQRLVARLEVVVDLELVYLPEQLVVRSARASARQRASPVLIGQGDSFARDEARRTAIDELVDETLKAVCRGSPAKLEKQIGKARVKAAAARGVR